MNLFLTVSFLACFFVSCYASGDQYVVTADMYRTQFEWGNEYVAYVTDESFEITTDGVSVARVDGTPLQGTTVREVQAIHYQNRNMKYLPTNMYQMFDNLITYRVENCNLEVLGNFMGQYKHVNFDRNLIREIPKSSFANAVNLEWISMNENLIETIDEDFFTTMPQLRVVSFAGNRIRQIGGGLFRNNHNLEYVYFNGNGLTNIGVELFRGQNNLAVINFDSNICINDAYYHDTNAVANLEQQFRTYCSGQCDNAGKSYKEMKKLEEQNMKMKKQNWAHQNQKQMKCGHQGRQRSSSSSSSSSTSSESSSE